MTNIECFDMAAASILANLYKAFPERQKVVMLEWEKEAIAEERFLSGCKLQRRNERHCFFAEVAIWLADEGVIRYTDCRGGIFAGLVLTARGFRALRQPIEELTDRPTIGKRLIETATWTGSQVAAASINALLASLRC